MNEKVVKLIIYIISFGIVFAGITMFTQCEKTEYCKVSGCPAQAAYKSDYCVSHRCRNTDCKNKRYDDFAYCLECLERVGY